MKGKDVSRTIIVISLVLMLGALFLIINLDGFNKKKENKVTTTTTIKTEATPPVYGDKINDREDGIIIVDGVNKEVKLKTFVAALGYAVDYLYESFTPVKVSNTSLVIMNNDDHNIFLKIEVLNEDNYYDQYESSLKGVYDSLEELDNYKYEYKFFRGNGLFLKITKCISENNQNSEVNSSLDYMIASIEINK